MQRIHTLLVNFSIYILLINSINIYSQAEYKVNDKDLKCLQYLNSDNTYLKYSSELNPYFSLIIKSDICDKLQLQKEFLKTDFEGSVYLKFNDSLYSLQTDLDYRIYNPANVYVDDTEKLFIIEFQIISFISMFEYHFLILDFRNNKEIRFTEISTSRVKNNIKKLFKNYKRDKFAIKNIILSKQYQLARRSRSCN